ncbi:hypothetical protein ANCDUO_04846 [Ancylostoma duodenale]|uniref:Uncharacterized protein n=1 Tax=Ancylostoma duodenale TaxID=51022 RepID=A0A0C2D5I1_9BILA|nr:hypothetical protein ANCDUO_04846 [Ancylostoma duodenale]
MSKIWAPVKKIAAARKSDKLLLFTCRHLCIVRGSANIISSIKANAGAEATAGWHLLSSYY